MGKSLHFDMFFQGTISPQCLHDVLISKDTSRAQRIIDALIVPPTSKFKFFSTRVMVYNFRVLFLCN